MNISHFIDALLKRVRLFSRYDPARDWFALLGCAVIILTGIVVWDAWVFDTIANGGTIGAPATSTPPIFSQSSIDSIHAVFDMRAAEEAKYVSGAYRYADPSQ